MSEGWISLHRSLLDNTRANNPEWGWLWVNILLLATHTERTAVFGNKEITLKPGQFITSRRSLSAHSGINEFRVERRLKMLETAQMITQQSSSKSRLLTVVNWNKFQGTAQEDVQLAHNKRTTSAQQAHTNNNDNNINNINNSILSEFRLRLLHIFVKTPRFPRPVDEDKAWQKVEKALTIDEVKLLEEFYTEPKDEKKHNQLWSRKSKFITLCNQLTSQIDLATAYFSEKNSGGGCNTDSNGIPYGDDDLD